MDPLTNKQESLGTFPSKVAADRVIREADARRTRGEWVSPQQSRTRFASEWLADKKAAKRPSTYKGYEKDVRLYLLPHFGRAELGGITEQMVRRWHAELVANPPEGATEDGWRRVSAPGIYRTLHGIMATAVQDRLIPINPCRIKGAGVARPLEREIVTLEQVLALVDAAEPRYRLVILLGSFAALRFSEIMALTREDVRLDTRTIRVRTSKAAAGVRTVHYPGFMDDAVATHLDHFAGPRYLFMGSRGGRLPASRWNPYWIDLRSRMGHPNLRFHDLRHTGLTLAARSGATLPDLMNRTGHTTPRAALVYLHTDVERDRAVAASMDALVAKAKKDGP